MEDKQVKVRFPWIRIFFSVLLIFVYIIVGKLQGPIESQLAVGQLQNSATVYAFSQAAATGHLFDMFQWFIISLFVIIWASYVMPLIKLRSTKAFMIALVFLSPGLISCGPPEVPPLEEIQANETAFVVPLEGATKEGQGKFMSLEYLENAKVATKRIVIPVKSRTIGRGPGNYEWIPTLKVIKLDRTSVTREWTKGHETGTTIKNEAIGVESLDSINFRVGLNVTALITEEDAARFLYYNAGRSLADVMDTNIRGKTQAVLAREFGSRSLTQCKSEKASIFLIANAEVSEYTKSIGVTISSFGSAEGLLYDNPEIQTAIDRAYKAEMDVVTATQEKNAQIQRNELLVAKAVAERAAAQEFEKAQEAAVARIRLEIESKRADAMLVAAQRWNGNAPQSILPQGSQLLFGLDQQSK